MCVNPWLHSLWFGESTYTGDLYGTTQTSRLSCPSVSVIIKRASFRHTDNPAILMSPRFALVIVECFAARYNGLRDGLDRTHCTFMKHVFRCVDFWHSRSRTRTFTHFFFSFFFFLLLFFKTKRANQLRVCTICLHATILQNRTRVFWEKDHEALYNVLVNALKRRVHPARYGHECSQCGLMWVQYTA